MPAGCIVFGGSRGCTALAGFLLVYSGDTKKFAELWERSPVNPRHGKHAFCHLYPAGGKQEREGGKERLPHYATDAPGRGNAVEAMFLTTARMRGRQHRAGLTKGDNG